MDEKVSVLMSTYNEPYEWLIESIDSVINQTYSNIELVIIVDNNQNPAINRLINDYRNKVNFYINEKNIGLVASLNKGLNYCTGKYIARMDADDISDPKRIENELRYLRENNYDLVGSDYRPFDNKGIGSIHHTASSARACSKMLRYCSCIAHPTWLVKREVFTELNGYRNIDAAEDYDFLIRAALKGYKIGNINQTLLLYRINTNSISHIKRVHQYSVSQFMAYNYRRRKIPSLEEIALYQESDHYLNNIIYAKKYLNLEKIRINTIKNEIGYFVFFVRQKYYNQCIKIIRVWDRHFGDASM